MDRTREAIADLPVEADVVQVGSTARGTWVAGDRDIDLFVRFDEDLDRAELEEYGLDVGHAVLPDGHEEFAEHPYVKGSYEGFDVDLVPCHDVERAAKLVSAVDRTPFHDAYLSARLDDDLAGDVVLAKAFLKGIGAYGSDLRTEGFSGYLTELLVLELGGFVPLVESARSWHPPVEFDPEGHAE
ncbi:tRNA CCA-pyrophosphorylase, partial [Halorubrum sp. E3]